jgi:hypothetical protein
MSYAREKENFQIFQSENFTVSNDCLKEKVNGVPNYEFIFQNQNYLNQLSKNYVNHGITVTDDEIIEDFLKHEAEANEEVKKIFSNVRNVLGVVRPPKEAKKEEVPKPEEKKVTLPETHETKPEDNKPEEHEKKPEEVPAEGEVKA